MSSGFKNMQINTQERAISPDINRLQKFAGADMAELFRYLIDVTGNADVTSGRIVEPNTVETPLRGEIIAGLMVKPQLGSTDIQIDPGMCFLMSPDGAADESNYKYVHDAGVPTNGVLSVAANASGSIRVDVIECRMNPVNLIVSDSRDIFNPATGLFTASLVNKEITGRLEYRVRAGTPAAGMPANASGWLPLCVAVVPNGSTNNDAVMFYDVRPLIADRDGSISGYTTDIPRTTRRWLSNVGVSGPAIQTGYVDLTFRGRRVGGKLGIGVAGADTNQVALASHLSSGYVNTNGQIYYVYLAFPFGLPRWARYTDSGSGSRLPRNPVGIPVVSHVVPNLAGEPSSTIGLPTACGLGGSTTAAVAAWAGTMASGSPGIVQANGKGLLLDNSPTIPQSGANGNVVQFHLTPGVHYPMNARRIKGRMICVYDASDGGAEVSHVAFVEIDPPGSAGALLPKVYQLQYAAENPGGGGVIRVQVDLPTPMFYPGTAPAPWIIYFQTNAETNIDATTVTWDFRIEECEID